MKPLFRKNQSKKYLVLSILILAGALPFLNNACNGAFNISNFNDDSKFNSLALMKSPSNLFTNFDVKNLKEIPIHLTGIPESFNHPTASAGTHSQNSNLNKNIVVSLMNTQTGDILSTQNPSFKNGQNNVLKFYITEEYYNENLEYLSFVLSGSNLNTKKVALTSLKVQNYWLSINLKDSTNTPELVENAPSATRNTASDPSEAGSASPPPPVFEDPTQEDPIAAEIEIEGMTPSKNLFHYIWKSDGTGLELEQTMGEPRKPQIEILGQTVTPSNLSYASTTLETNYNLILSNNGDIPWDAEHSQRLLKTITSIPHRKINHTVSIELVSQYLADDIEITKEQGKIKKVALSQAAFNNSSPKLVKLDGKKGIFFSRRLFHAIVRFLTDEGRNTRAIKKILLDKFNLKLHEEVRNYKQLTATDEPKEHFQPFQPNELIFLITSMAEMPQGYFKIPGLNYLLRRKEGHPHPLYPNAAAVAWPRGPNKESYIEFMTSAFSSQGPDYIHRLILHEKSHFIYKNLLAESLRAEWRTIGGWYENKKDSDGWSTRQTTTFPSAYAHAHNPNEDFAECLSYYIINPQNLLSVAPDKYQFITSRIMNGYRYHAQIREDLTFQVLNLYPDYDFPGKIIKVDVKARGASNEDKKVTVQLKLHNHPDFNDGARRAYTRITSPVGTFKDLGMYPLNGDPHTLQGSLTIPATAAQGYWTVDQIRITDRVKNERYQGISDFGFKLYINNPGEDLLPPEYVADSLEINSSETLVEGRTAHNVQITWDVIENKEMNRNSSVAANLVYVGAQKKDIYPLFNYGGVEEIEAGLINGRIAKKYKAKVNILMTNFFRNGDYTVTYVNLFDKALNRSGQYFSDSNEPNHEHLRFINMNTTDPDLEKPVIDINNIQITAVPANPSNPDGTTRLTIRYRAKDNKSGVGKTFYILLDPVGKTHYSSHRHENFFTPFFKGGDPTVYKNYTVSRTLPKGSPPGTWGLKEMIAEDKAGNIRSYNFSEVVHFEVVD